MTELCCWYLSTVFNLVHAGSVCSAPLIRPLDVLSPTSFFTNPQCHLLFPLPCFLRWCHQPVCARGAAGVHRGQRAFGRRDSHGLSFRGQAGGHPTQPRVLRTPQRGAMCAAVGHHLQRPSLHQGESEMMHPAFKSPAYTLESRHRGCRLSLSASEWNFPHMP